MTTTDRRPTRVPPGLGEPLALAGTAVAALGGLAAVYAHPSVAVPACPSLSLFGVLCPLCGGTRAAHSLLTGDLGAVLGYNALLPVLLLLAGWGWASYTARRVGWRTVPAIPRYLLGVLAGAAVAYGVARNLPWAPFSALAP